MRALFTVAGGHGHLYPLLPLAQALVDDGVEVAVAVPEGYRNLVPDSLPAFVLPFPPAAVNDEHRRRQAQRSPSERGHAAVARYLDLALLHTGALAEIAAGWRADVIVRETTAYAGWFAGEVLNLPVAVFDFVGTPPWLLAARLGGSFEEARGRLGLPTDPDLVTMYRWLRIMAAPPGWFVRAEIGPTTHIFRPPPGAPVDVPPPRWLRNLDRAGPAVYVTMGTVYNHTAGVFEAVLDALAGERVRVVATVGPDAEPRRLRHRPSQVYVTRFVPQAVVLPRVDAVVCHGGYGSLMGALRHGLPVVTIPLAAADHAANAARVRRLGVGVVLPEGTRSGADIGQAVHSVLTERRYREAAGQIADAVTHQPPLALAARLVAQLAASRAPICRVPSGHTPPR